MPVIRAIHIKILTYNIYKYKRDRPKKKIHHPDIGEIFYVYKNSIDEMPYNLSRCNCTILIET